MKNIRTTVIGIFMILGALGDVVVSLLDSDPATNPEWKIAIGAIAIGWGLIFAREQKTHDEENEPQSK